MAKQPPGSMLPVRCRLAVLLVLCLLAACIQAETLTTTGKPARSSSSSSRLSVASASSSSSSSSKPQQDASEPPLRAVIASDKEISIMIDPSLAEDEPGLSSKSPVRVSGAGSTTTGTTPQSTPASSSSSKARTYSMGEANAILQAVQDRADEDFELDEEEEEEGRPHRSSSSSSKESRERRRKREERKQQGSVSWSLGRRSASKQRISDHSDDEKPVGSSWIANRIRPMLNALRSRTGIVGGSTSSSKSSKRYTRQEVEDIVASLADQIDWSPKKSKHSSEDDEERHSSSHSRDGPDSDHSSRHRHEEDEEEERRKHQHSEPQPKQQPKIKKTAAHEHAEPEDEHEPAHKSGGARKHSSSRRDEDAGSKGSDGRRRVEDDDDDGSSRHHSKRDAEHRRSSKHSSEGDDEAPRERPSNHHGSSSSSSREHREHDKPSAKAQQQRQQHGGSSRHKHDGDLQPQTLDPREVEDIKSILDAIYEKEGRYPSSIVVRGADAATLDELTHSLGHEQQAAMADAGADSDPQAYSLAVGGDDAIPAEGTALAPSVAAASASGAKPATEAPHPAAAGPDEETEIVYVDYVEGETQLADGEEIVFVEVDADSSQQGGSVQVASVAGAAQGAEKKNKAPAAAAAKQPQ